MPADDLTDPAPPLPLPIWMYHGAVPGILRAGHLSSCGSSDSTPRIMDPNIVGSEHYDVARKAKILQVRSVAIKS